MNTSGRECVEETCKKQCSEIKLFGVQIGVSTEDGGGAAVSPSPSSSAIRKSKSLDNLSNACADDEPSGYLSDGILHEFSKSHQRKRGKPWSEAEHRSFLEGLQKLGKGDWKGIATKYVPSRKSSQVASHAQKYFNRLHLQNANKKRRRGSVFDIPFPNINDNQPSQSNNGYQSLHIATSSSTPPAVASINVGEIKESRKAHHHVVTTSERPPLSPRKPSQIPVYYQPRISWVPVYRYARQNMMATMTPQQYADRFGYIPQPSTIHTTTTDHHQLHYNISNLKL